MESHDTILALSTGTGAIVYNLEEISKAKNEDNELILEDLKTGVLVINDCHSKVGCEFIALIILLSNYLPSSWN